MSDVVKWDWMKIWAWIWALVGSLIVWASIIRLIWGISRG